MDPIHLMAVRTPPDNEPEPEPTLLECDGDTVLLTLATSGETLQLNRRELRAALDEAA